MNKTFTTFITTMYNEKMASAINHVWLKSGNHKMVSIDEVIDFIDKNIEEIEQDILRRSNAAGFVHSYKIRNFIGGAI